MSGQSTNSSDYLTRKTDKQREVEGLIEVYKREFGTEESPGKPSWKDFFVKTVSVQA